MQVSQATQSAETFRLDINALRAVSVIAVVGYHFRIPGFAGGFVGVDFFLVITGYLMTGKVLSDLTRDRFSFPAFGLMRMRRIYPALAVMTVSSVVAGWFLTLPGEYQKHLLQALSALTFVSNFAFNSDNGYFAMAAQTKPLLHTWSLSLEWQFYIWMPVVVWLVWRLTSNSRSRMSAAIVVLQAVAAASLLWCLWENYSDAMGSSFFSLRARAWEPLAGGLLAAMEIRRRSELPARAFWMETMPTAVGGWLLVAACIVYPLREVRWPGALTMLPILGATLIVGARQWAGDGSPFRTPCVQRVGDWSYSIYLWHWPIWVFVLSWQALRGRDVDAMQKAFMVLTSLVLGAMSYYFVEQPVRMRRHFWTPRMLLNSYGVLFALLVGFVALAYLDKGFPGRLPAYLLPAELARRTNTPHDECFRNSNSAKTATETYCGFGQGAPGKLSAILWGDSFANQYLEPASSAALANGIHGLIATQSGCRAFIDDPATNSGDQTPCRDFNRDTLEFVLGHAQPSVVVLGSNWDNADEVSRLVDRLISSGKIVILIMPVLSLGFDVPQRWIEEQVRAGKAIDEWKIGVSPAQRLSSLRVGFMRIVNRYRTSPNLVTVDPVSTICDRDQCYLVRNGQANFRDAAHISNVNAMQYEGLFDAAFRSALEAAGEKQKKPYDSQSSLHRVAPSSK